MAISLETSLSGDRPFFAQVKEVGFRTNGHDANAIVDLRTGTAKTLGIPMPAAAPTSSENGAGSVNGSVSYRARWKDSSTQTLSLPSAALAVTTASKTIRVTRPGSPPSRASHWVLERTDDGGGVYYPVNVDVNNPDGTAIATTTYDDNVSDSTLRQRTTYDSTQAQPPLMRCCFVNRGIPVLFGGIVHRPACSLTNGAAAVTSTDGKFTADMVGWDFSFDADTDGVTYKVLSYTNANAITLASNYAGTTKSAQPASMAGPYRDSACWGEPGDNPEYFGSAEIGVISNLVRYGDDGEALTAGVSLGLAGWLMAKQTRLFLHSYTVSPLPPGIRDGDGRITTLQSRRGALSPASLFNADGMLYGMDVFGVWRAQAGSEPEEIGGPIANDWRSLNFTKADNFHIGYDPLARVLAFFVCETGVTYPKKAYLWDLETARWIGTKTWPVGVTCSTMLPDRSGALRMVFFTEASGTANSYAWFDNIGTSAGAPPTAPNLTGSVTSGGASTLTNSGAAFPTSGTGLAGVPVKLVRAADSSEETGIIASNTATALTLGSAWTGSQPTSGDTYIIGGLECSWKTARLTMGDPVRKKKFIRAYVWVIGDTLATTFKSRAYYDGDQSNAFADRALIESEQGVTTTLNAAPVTLDPTQNAVCYKVPLGSKFARDVQLEFYSDTPGRAWQIVRVDLEAEVDDSADPRN